VACRDVDHGLSLAPDNARLLCTAGLLDIAAGNPNAAMHALTDALEQDPTLAEAWANRATLFFEAGDTESAIADLTEALVHDDDPAIRHNLAVALGE
jgi:Tfp pilus assembly protein PilF